MLEHLEPCGKARPRVVVLGAGGFIGRAIAHAAGNAGFDVVAVTRAEIDLELERAADRLCGTVRDGDCLVFAAARAPARTSDLLLRNLRMAEPVCAALNMRSPSHLVYVSSDAVYSDAASPVTERSDTAPSTLHGVMHLARETMLGAAARCPVAVLRPTLIYGPGDPHNGYGPNRFWREAVSSKRIHIFGDGEEKRDHIFIGDVARLAVDLIQHRSKGALNAVTGHVLAFRDIAETIAEIAGPGVAVESVPRPGPRPHLLHRHFDATARMTAFPRFQPVPLKLGLERYTAGG